MKTLDLSDAAKATGGILTGEGTFTGVYTDSRRPVKGGLFVALEGERFDGHAFIPSAQADGAAAVMCRKKCDTDLPVILVSDTKKALLALASYYRGLFDIPVIGLTGSVGKTTTKELTALVMESKYKTVKTQGNLNNDIGMPLTIFNFREDTEAAVIEMGMNHKGEISALTAVSRPSVGIITNIGVSHIENLGSRENILAAKLEILEGMEKGSTLVVNGDNDLLSGVEIDGYNVVKFGIENENSSVRAVDIKQLADSYDFNILYENKKYAVHLPVPGIHNILNALAAFTAGVAAGVDPVQAADAMAKYVPEGMRQKVVSKNGIRFIEDCYNASPDSVRAGVNVLTSFEDSARTVAVLGDMLELGDYSETAHRQCGAYAAEKEVDILFAYGSASSFTADEAEKKGVREVYHYTDEKELAGKIASVIKAGDTVLFKASRGMHLENVIQLIYDMI